jgi:hypothetical protein
VYCVRAPGVHIAVCLLNSCVCECVGVVCVCVSSAYRSVPFV